MMNFYSKVPTELHLNGPNVKISTNPINVTASLAGVATFTAISTATFPYNETNGTFNFQWYFDGNKINDTSVDSSSNASIESSSGISTFTLNGINGNDNQKPIFVVATYNPGPDENIISYPAEGINKATSSSAVLTAPPSIVITKQPSTVLIGSGNTAEFSIDAEISPSANVPISYKWELEGSELTNGTATKTVQVSGDTFPKMTITNDTNSTVETIDWSQLSVYDSFAAGVTYNLTVTGGNLTTTLIAKGAGGGTSDGRSVSGGAGGESTGTFTFVNGQTYKLNVGQSGANAGPGGFSGGGNGGGGEGLGGGGGGYTGLFSDSITIGNSVIIAGGGGGGANDPAAGGAGGGLTGGDAGNAPGRGGEGGTQSAGGGGGQDNGAALQGGPGAAGGGGGYYGGAGGNPFPICCADGAGGGGSGYIGGVTDGTTTNGTGAEAAQDGSFSITRVSSTKTITTTISGAGTNNLKIFSNDVDYGGVLKCVLSASGVLNSPLESNTVSYDVIPARPIVQFEGYSFDNKYATASIDLNLADYALTDSTFGSDYGIIQFHVKEIDTIIQLDVKASAGADFSFIGGEGGTSSFAVLARKNVEYTILGISNNSAVFIYEKSQLIAVVGKGGDAGTNGRGGAGGGVRSDGAVGQGNGAGDGGTVPSLQVSNGIFGSVVRDYATLPTVYTGDTIADAPNGGLTITCSRGSYWADQGIAACSDISSGEIQFNNIDGTSITESSSLYRGFKPGYTISETSGKTSDPTNGGNGGAGAAGGNGASSNGGGGGGSGYTSGSITVLSSTLGGNTTKKSSIEFKSVSTGGLYVDGAGRILILSCATPNKDPRTLSITGGKVLPGTDSCIDDTRWQAYLALATSTNGYRLGVTLDNSTSRIIDPTSNNIRRMLNANVFTLRTSLLGWTPPNDVVPADIGYANRLTLAWDETSGQTITGLDYSLMFWVKDSGFGYYGESSNPFWTNPIASYSHSTANWWILPPGVPNF